MRAVLKKIVRIPFRIIVYLRWYSILAFLYSIVIEELTDDGNTTRPSKRAGNNKLTILILSPVAFRKDIELIVRTNAFRVLRISIPWETRLSSQFSYASKKKYTKETNSDQPNFKYKKEQKVLQDFLKAFLGKLYERIEVDCVISPHPRYIFDMEWGALSTQLGVPHILLPRDSQLASSPFELKEEMYLFKYKLPKFKGSHIIIQSRRDGTVYTDSGYAKLESVSCLGCPRMDNFMKKSKEINRSKINRKKVVFLPFRWGLRLEKSDLFAYICDVHSFFVHFALRYPEIDVVVKPKPKQPLVPKKMVLLEQLKNISIEIEKIPNLTIREDLDLHDLFLETDVVCGLQTSALLEAAVIGLPVIIPYFKDLQNQKYDERLFYRDAYDLFDIANDVKELEMMILQRLRNPAIDKKVMMGRKGLFEEFVSTLDCNATEKYAECIKQVIENQRL